MPRKLTRRERLERQERRDEALDAGMPMREEVVTQRSDREAGISYTGAFGGLLGAGIFFTLAVAIMVDPADNSRLWAIPFVAAGVFFIPSVVASLIPGYAKRARVLRWGTIGSMLIALAGSVVIGSLALAVLLAPTTALLAIGAGLIFQGSQAKR